VTFHWKESWRGTDEESGLVAQDVQKLFPDAVEPMQATDLTPGGTLEIKEPNLVAYLIKAVQELAARSDNSDAGKRLDAQQAQIDDLRNQIHIVEDVLVVVAMLALSSVAISLHRRA
jgi:hypothetical protein